MSDYHLELYDGSYIVLNSSLVCKQGVYDNLENIKKIHYEKSVIHDIMENTDDVGELRLYSYLLTELEFELQELWGFPRDSKYHRFWNIPKCTCPKMDNEDFYPSKHCYMDLECPIHGKD